MWHSYTYTRAPCAEGCCRRAGAHPNNFWACPACINVDKATELEKLLRHFEIVNHGRKQAALGPHILKYRKEYVRMGGAISTFQGSATALCDKRCCWRFDATPATQP